MVEVYQKHNVILTVNGVCSVNTKDPEAAAAREKVAQIVTAHPHVLQMHGFYLHRAEKTLRFDIVSFDAPNRGQVYREFCEAVQQAYPDYTNFVILAYFCSSFLRRVPSPSGWLASMSSLSACTSGSARMLS